MKKKNRYVRPSREGTPRRHEKDDVFWRHTRERSKNALSAALPSIIIVHDLPRFRLLHLTYPELIEGGYNSSVVREARYAQLVKNKTVTSKQDLLNVLGNNDDDPFPLFSDRAEARVSTINLGKDLTKLV